MEYARAKAALAKGDFELVDHFNSRALDLNPTHGHVNFQTGFIAYGKLVRQLRHYYESFLTCFSAHATPGDVLFLVPAHVGC